MNHRRRLPFSFAIATAIVVTLAVTGAAEPSQSPEEDSRPAIGQLEDDGEEERDRTISATPNTVDAQLAEAEKDTDPLFDAGPLDPLQALWSVPTDWLREELGLSLGLNYTMLYQHASRARGPNDGFFGDLDLLGRWELVDFDGVWPGALAFQTEWRHRMASDTPGQLRPRIGSQWSTALSSNPERYAVTELYWEQGRSEDGLIARVGKIDPTLIYDGGRYVSQNLAFLSAAFSDSPAMSFPAAGLGAAVAAFPNDWLYVVGGVHDASSRRTQTGFNSIDDADFFYAGEIGLTPAWGTDYEGLYHVTVWRSEKAARIGKPSGEGFQIHAEQQMGWDGDLVPFVRYGYASGGINATKQMVAAGLGLEEPLGRGGDLAGMGFAWGDADRSQDQDQYTIEAFYRVQVTPLTNLTPDVQVILNPSEDKSRGSIWLLSLRVRTVF